MTHLSKLCVVTTGSNRKGPIIVDIGAGSTLSHVVRVADAAQNSKVLPAIKEVRAARMLVSVETYHLTVARACLDAGANILNLSGTDGGDELTNGGSGR